MDSPIIWSILYGRTWAAVGLLLSLAVPVQPVCPRDVVTRAQACFTPYKVKLHNMRESQQKLCCGVDVETLRAFCHSYSNAKRCMTSLRDSCPTHMHYRINQAQDNLDDSDQVLSELCSDDSIIESYAMYQHCFREISVKSERCFAKHLNQSRRQDDIRFLSQVQVDDKNKFCRNMRNLVSCVEKNYKQCSEQAAKLASVLVKPMVRRSWECDYTQSGHQQTTRSSHANPAYINAGGHGNKQTDTQTHNSGRGLAGVTAYIIIVPALTSLWIRLLRAS